MMLLVKSSCKDDNDKKLITNRHLCTKSNLIDNEVTAIGAALDPHEVLRLMVVVQVGQQPASRKIDIKNFKIFRY